MNGRTDTVIRSEGMNMLIERLGMVEAQRFVALIQKDSFDYTKWRENLFDDLSLEELSQKAREYRNTRAIEDLTAWEQFEASGRKGGVTLDEVSPWLDSWGTDNKTCVIAPRSNHPAK